MALEIEREYVYDTYQKIANGFSKTRTYLWKGVKQFLNKVEPYSIIVEIGSGNGKNLLYRKDCINMAFDLCENFTKITNARGIESVVSNNLNIPMVDNSADYVLSIAVVHHLYTVERRLQSIKELIRILKPGGKLLIQVWAMRQPEKSRRKFVIQDNFVEFNSSDKILCEKRFYHVFREGELEALVGCISDIIIIDSYWEMGNWVMIIKKI